jgi:hypothetical protein
VSRSLAGLVAGFGFRHTRTYKNAHLSDRETLDEMSHGKTASNAHKYVGDDGGQ